MSGLAWRRGTDLMCITEALMPKSLLACYWHIYLSGTDMGHWPREASVQTARLVCGVWRLRRLGDELRPTRRDGDCPAIVALVTHHLCFAFVACIPSKFFLIPI